MDIFQMFFSTRVIDFLGIFLLPYYFSIITAIKVIFTVTSSFPSCWVSIIITALQNALQRGRRKEVIPLRKGCFVLTSFCGIVEFEDCTHLAQTLPNCSVVRAQVYYLFQLCQISPFKSPSRYLFVSALSADCRQYD